ncbi:MULTISPECIES: chemotaxis protein CheB [unclassified Polaromonas]|uniref:chemotaxis protein CheB n=1 Tax=unclassified Polaromonas TaxID=2638319 RepID=UPI000F0881E9|nr:MULTISPECIES: chemotaxis protein CheB [unclassified Polaromonas]AYQ26730.1 chemotaxis protein CheB [Polaromonas sp. SP1]QGJ18424.1 chemotaxis protein CheB [Polaromonas sp. Pch-P]
MSTRNAAPAAGHTFPVHKVDAVVIGASAGGVDALLQLLTGLPDRYRLPIVAVLHLPDTRDSLLADIFRQRLAMQVHEAADKESVTPGTLYFAGAGYHLSIEKDRSFSLSCEAPVHYSRPSIDLLMESAADAYGARLAGILLTGANFDGAAGLARISERGGLTVVQDPAEAQVATMPEAAIARLQPSLVLPLDGIRRLLLQLDSLP